MSTANARRWAVPRTPRGSAVAALVLGAGLTLAACGSVAEEAAEQAIEESLGGGNVEVEDDGLKITDDEGNEIATGSQASLPEEWPDEIPVPEGDLISSTASPNAVSITVQSDGDADAIFTDLKSQVEAAGFSAEFTSQNEDVQAASLTRGEEIVSITVIDDEDGVTIQMSAGNF